jgi:phosphoenolpyruvate carboxylase
MSRPCSRPKPRWNTAAASSMRCWPSPPTAPMPARGRVAIQTGFSDAGRFVGQIPASAGDRAAARPPCRSHGRQWPGRCRRADLQHPRRSMGRGAHPASFADRLAWPLSPWARRRLPGPASGWSPKSAFRAATAICSSARPNWRWPPSPASPNCAPAETDLAAPADPFYHRTDISLDFYRAIKEHQGDHLASRTYARAVTAFGLGLLNPPAAASLAPPERHQRRPRDEPAPDPRDPAQRDPPAAGLSGQRHRRDRQRGGRNREEIAALLHRQPRGRQILRLVRAPMRWPASRPWRPMASCSIRPIGPAAPIAGPRITLPMPAWRWRNISPAMTAPACSAAWPRASGSTRSSCTACRR